eukprot:Lankesteria_metandrocarpae@DN434_c0_g1_i1.p1
MKCWRPNKAFWENLADLFVSKSCAVTTAFVWSEVIQGTLVAAITWDATHLTERPSPQSAQTVQQAWEGFYFSFITYVLVLLTCTCVAVYSEGKMNRDIKRLAAIQIKSQRALEDQQDSAANNIEGPFEEVALLDNRPQKLLKSAKRLAMKLMCWQVVTNGLIIVPAFSLATACGYLLALVALSTKSAGMTSAVTAICISSLVTGITIACALVAILLVVFVPDNTPPTSKRCCLGSTFCKMSATQAKVAMAVAVGVSWDALIRAVLINPFNVEWVIFVYAAVVTIATPFLYWNFLDAEKPLPNPATGKVSPLAAMMYSVQTFLGIALSSIVGWAWRDCWKYLKDLIAINGTVMQILWNVLFAIALTFIGSLVVVALSGWQQRKNDKAAKQEEMSASGSKHGGDAEESVHSDSSSVSALMRRSTARMAEVLTFAMGIDVGWAWTEVIYAVFLATIALMHPQKHICLVFLALLLYGIVSTLLVAAAAVSVIRLAVWGKGEGDVFITDMLRAASPDVSTEKLLVDAEELARQSTLSTIDRQSSGAEFHYSFSNK